MVCLSFEGRLGFGLVSFFFQSTSTVHQGPSKKDMWLYNLTYGVCDSEDALFCSFG